MTDQAPRLSRTDCERALRAAGVPARLAKRILAAGWAGGREGRKATPRRKLAAAA